MIRLIRIMMFFFEDDDKIIRISKLIKIIMRMNINIIIIRRRNIMIK